MNKVLNYAFLGLLFLVACTKAVSPSLSGDYVLDSEALKSALKNSGDKMISDMPEDVLKQVLEGMKTFHIEIKDTEATAIFGETKVKGTLKKSAEADGATTYVMTPTDEDKKGEVVKLIIKGDSLTLDPGKKDIDKMYFKKTAVK